MRLLVIRVMKKYRELVEAMLVELPKDYVSVRAAKANRPFNGYVGWTGYGNLGDEAVFEAFDSLFPDEHFVPCRVATKPVQIFQRITGRDVPINNMALGGGTLINQSRIWLEHVEYAVARSVPVFCLGSGVASSSFWGAHPGLHSGGDLERWAAALRRFAFVGVRGPLSQQALKELGVCAEIVGDTALALTPEAYDAKRPFKQVIGLNVSYGTDNVMYGDSGVLLREMAVAVRQLCNEGYTVNIFPIWPADMSASKALEAAVRHNNCKIVCAYANTREYMSAIDGCDFFIGEKLHATIFSTMLRKPSLMLEYRPKCLDYMRSLSMERYSLRTDSVKSTIVVDLIAELSQNRSLIAEALDERVMFYKRMQEKHAANIRNSLRLSNEGPLT